jgi:hypothetical protein
MLNSCVKPCAVAVLHAFKNLGQAFWNDCTEHRRAASEAPCHLNGSKVSSCAQVASAL